MIHAMAALRMSIPVAVVRRSFSSTSKMMANVRKRPAFVKRKAGIGAAKEAAGIVHPGVRQTLAGKDQVLHNMEPSGRRSVITIWNATNKSSEESTIDISGERQFDFLSRFQQLDSEGGSLEDKKRLCAELRIIPSDLHGMATISLKDAPQFKELSCTILRLSADIGHAPSLCELVARSFTDRSPVSGVDLQKLKELTNSQTPDGRLAMSIMGVYHASRKQYGDAMRMLTGATEVESEIRITATAYFNMALIQLIQKDWESAMKALRKAAEAGETRAKYWLATQAEDGTPLQIATYEGAAATGMTEACHNLGHAELTKSSRQPGRPRLLRDYGMAREWFEAAAANEYDKLSCNSHDSMFPYKERIEWP
ncbi:hypothetical protein BJ878DRAFT_255369 [Calycina marina]|uniref:Uncharacterized protein n=1 Tax=Calycina marina TaxID=1763456 RepID=A0A9P7Z8B9_9HELO|nr:hypothetical protein BJ878DRAFT_255369 [Calycina marina]